MSNEKNIEISLTYFQIGTISDLILACRNVADVLSIGKFTELYIDNLNDFNNEITKATKNFETLATEIRSKFYEEKVNEETNKKEFVIKEGLSEEDYRKEFDILDKKFNEDISRIKNMVVKKEISENTFRNLYYTLLNGIELQGVKQSLHQQKGMYEQFVGIVFDLTKNLSVIYDNLYNLEDEPCLIEKNEEVCTEED